MLTQKDFCLIKCLQPLPPNSSSSRNAVEWFLCFHRTAWNKCCLQISVRFRDNTRNEISPSNFSFRYPILCPVRLCKFREIAKTNGADVLCWLLSTFAVFPFLIFALFTFLFAPFIATSYTTLFQVVFLKTILDFASSLSTFTTLLFCVGGFFLTITFLCRPLATSSPSLWRPLAVSNPYFIPPTYFLNSVSHTLFALAKRTLGPYSTSSYSKIRDHSSANSTSHGILVTPLDPDSRHWTLQLLRPGLVVTRKQQQPTLVWPYLSPCPRLRAQYSQQSPIFNLLSEIYVHLLSIYRARPQHFLCIAGIT